MGDIRSGIGFVYQWFLRGTKWKEFGIFAAIGIGFLICVSLALFLGFFGIILGILLGLVLLIVLVGALYTCQGIALRELNYPARFYEFKLGEFLKWSGRWIAVVFTSVFNWVEPKILAAQLIAYFLIVIGIFFSPILGIGAAIALAANAYSGRRLALALPIRNIEKEEIGGAIKASWEYSDKKFWEIMGLSNALLLPAVLGISAIIAVMTVLGLLAIIGSIPFFGAIPTLEAILMGALISPLLIFIFIAVALILSIPIFSLAVAYEEAYVYHVIKRTIAGKYKRIE